MTSVLTFCAAINPRDICDFEETMLSVDEGSQTTMDDVNTFEPQKLLRIQTSIVTPRQEVNHVRNDTEVGNQRTQAF
jgi:hypothetical protein